MDSGILRAAMYAYGRSKAQELRANAPDMTDTDVIDQELFIPDWREGPQVAGAPVQYRGQVYRVLPPGHDSTGNPGWNPADTPALFGICHTKDPAKAKPWVSPHGQSGVYTLGDCYVDDEGIVHRQIFDGDNVYDAAAMPDRWETVEA